MEKNIAKNGIEGTYMSSDINMTSHDIMTWHHATDKRAHDTRLQTFMCLCRTFCCVGNVPRYCFFIRERHNKRGTTKKHFLIKSRYKDQIQGEVQLKKDHLRKYKYIHLKYYFWCADIYCRQAHSQHTQKEDRGELNRNGMCTSILLLFGHVSTTRNQLTLKHKNALTTEKQHYPHQNLYIHKKLSGVLSLTNRWRMNIWVSEPRKLLLTWTTQGGHSFRFCFAYDSVSNSSANRNSSSPSQVAVPESNNPRS